MRDNLAELAQEIYLEAFNLAYEEHDEETPRKIAWSADKNDIKKKWVGVDRKGIRLTRNHISPVVGSLQKRAFCEFRLGQTPNSVDGTSSNHQYGWPWFYWGSQMRRSWRILKESLY